jgi:hypothetical protein
VAVVTDAIRLGRGARQYRPSRCSAEVRESVFDRLLDGGRAVSASDSEGQSEGQNGAGKGSPGQAAACVSTQVAWSRCILAGRVTGE